MDIIRSSNPSIESQIMDQTKVIKPINFSEGANYYFNKITDNSYYLHISNPYNDYLVLDLSGIDHKINLTVNCSNMKIIDKSGSCHNSLSLSGYNKNEVIIENMIIDNLYSNNNILEIKKCIINYLKFE